MPKKPIVLPVGPWLPDQPSLNNDGSTNVRNVIARSSKSYGPSGGPAIYSSALNKRCQGANAFLDASGNVQMIAGDVNDLYNLVPGSTNWNVISKSAGAYAVPTDNFWNYAYFNGIVIATDFVDPMQAFTLGVSSAFADLSSAAPKARYCAVVKGFLAVGNTYDSVNGNQAQRVWWSAAGDPTNWPTPGTASAAEYQSSYTDLFGPGGWVQGIVGNLGYADGAVFQEHAVWRMNYAGPPDVFEFLPAENIRGTPAPGSIVQAGNLVYYLGEDGFYAFDGMLSRPIGADRFDKYFFSDLDQFNINRVIGTVDPINRNILWAYPGAGNVNGTPNHILCYNWIYDRATILDLSTECIARILSIGYTLDGLDNTGFNLDTLPASLDSRVWTGGSLLLGLFDTNHKLNFMTGSNLAPTVTTAEKEVAPGMRLRVSNARPLVDGGIPSVSIGHRERLQDSVAYTSPSALNSMGTCPTRTSGRYLRAQITLPAGSSFTHIQGVEVSGDLAGSR